MSLRDWLAPSATATPATPATPGVHVHPTVATVAAVAVAAHATPGSTLTEAAANADSDPQVDRRRARALALLAAEPSRHIAVIAEAGDPAHVTVAVRGVAVGELEIPAERYDGFALMALMQTHGHA